MRDTPAHVDEDGNVVYKWVLQIRVNRHLTRHEQNLIKGWLNTHTAQVLGKVLLPYTRLINWTTWWEKVKHDKSE